MLRNMVNFLYSFQTCPYLQWSVLERTEETSVLDPDQDHIDLWQADIMLLLLLTPNEVLKKTENRILISISGLGPSTNGKDLEKRNLENSKTQTNKKRTRMKDDTEIERCN